MDSVRVELEHGRTSGRNAKYRLYSGTAWVGSFYAFSNVGERMVSRMAEAFNATRYEDTAGPDSPADPVWVEAQKQITQLQADLRINDLAVTKLHVAFDWLYNTLRNKDLTPDERDMMRSVMNIRRSE